MEIRENLTSTNFNGRGTSPSWIVVHNTANGTSAAGTAWNNTQYFKSAYRGASANYFVDDGDTVWCCVEPTDTAWHCGEASSRNGAYNSNAIGIEVCEPEGGAFTAKERENLRELVQYLMGRFGIPASRVCRHYDVTGKGCPWYYTQNQGAWEELKDYITNGEDDMQTNDKIANGYLPDGQSYKNVGNCLVMAAQEAYHANHNALKNGTLLNNEKFVGIDGALVNNNWANAMDDTHKRVTEIAAKVERIECGGVDYDKLANMVADKLAERLKD